MITATLALALLQNAAQVSTPLHIDCTRVTPCGEVTTPQVQPPVACSDGFHRDAPDQPCYRQYKDDCNTVTEYEGGWTTETLLGCGHPDPVLHADPRLAFGIPQGESVTCCATLLTSSSPDLAAENAALREQNAQLWQIIHDQQDALNYARLSLHAIAHGLPLPPLPESMKPPPFVVLKGSNNPSPIEVVPDAPPSVKHQQFIHRVFSCKHHPRRCKP